MKPKAVFFDLDETLVNASQCHEDATEVLFKTKGIRYADILEKTKQIDLPRVHKIASLLEFPATLDRLGD